MSKQEGALHWVIGAVLLIVFIAGYLFIMGAGIVLSVAVYETVMRWIFG